MRLDQYLVAAGYFLSRAQAVSAIKAGRIRIDGEVVRRAAQSFTSPMQLEVQEATQEFVSRGGVKLNHALDFFTLPTQDIIAIDMGASTGGFSDALLQRGAAHIYAVDIGTDQLAPALQNDDRITRIEGVNGRDLSPAHISASVDALVVDVSFISLKHILPPAMTCLAQKAWLIALIKPQFEVGRAKLGKRGIVRSQAAREAVCDNICNWFITHYPAWTMRGITQSPLIGGGGGGSSGGNIEFLMAASRNLSP